MKHHFLALRALCALATLGSVSGALAQSAPASAPRAGPYVVAAAGRSHYDYDCYLLACDQTRGNASKLGFGYRFDVVGVEGWWIDHGPATTRNLGGPLRMRQAGINAVWTARWGAYLEGLLRAGGAQVQLTHPTGGIAAVSVKTSHFEPTFGLGLDVTVAPAVSIELAWDLVRGRSDSTDVLTQTVTLGLKLRF